MPDPKNLLTFRLLYEDVKLYAGIVSADVDELEILVRVSALTRAVEEELKSLVDAKHLLRCWVNSINVFKAGQATRNHAPAEEGEIKF